MRRLLPMFVLLVGTSAAAQAADAVKASKHLRLPPVEGVERRLPREFDGAPVLRFDGETDCKAFVARVSMLSSPPASPATVEERYDGCAALRRETANPAPVVVGSRYKYLRTI